MRGLLIEGVGLGFRGWGVGLGGTQREGRRERGNRVGEGEVEREEETETATRRGGGWG